MDAVVFEGPEAVDRFRLIVLRGAIRLYVRSGIRPNRGYTPANMRALATKYTGKPYARSAKGLQAALADLDALLGEVTP